LENSEETYIFVLSVMAESKAESAIIVHLVEKSVNIRLVGFCIIFDGETYCSGREKILTLIGKELHR
jgi:hypothetical protein